MYRPTDVAACSFNHVEAGAYLQEETRRIRYLKDWHPDMYTHMPTDLQPILTSDSLWGRYERAEMEQFAEAGWAMFGPAEQLMPTPTRALLAAALSELEDDDEAARTAAAPLLRQGQSLGEVGENHPRRGSVFPYSARTRGGTGER